MIVPHAWGVVNIPVTFVRDAFCALKIIVMETQHGSFKLHLTNFRRWEMRTYIALVASWLICNYSEFVRFQVVAVNVKITIFWDVTMCSLVNRPVCPRPGWTCYLHLQVPRNFATYLRTPWRHIPKYGNLCSQFLCICTWRKLGSQPCRMLMLWNWKREIFVGVVPSSASFLFFFFHTVRLSAVSWTVSLLRADGDAICSNGVRIDRYRPVMKHLNKNVI
jgi:hypothetical protein